MNDDTILGGVLNQLGQTAKKTVQQVVSLPEEKPNEEKKEPTATQGGEVKPAQQWQSDEERVRFLRGLYGSAQQTSLDKSSEKKPENKTSANPLTTAVENKKPSEFQEQIADKSPEEQKKLIELRNKLHKENYYDPTFNPPKKQEERPAEKVEKEKKQEMAELQKKEEQKPPPLAVQRAAQRVENLPGAG